ncbi:unnamed protein product [Cyprideis torosa]|uniref:Uncharacterized protein n=1 Tax=Cyprideis torosa TaxID=163714 RepID=A0A7R8W3H6_9CRUS|nr:unnamed protein product [Cyprideis torosa]CAG0882992.1 unnamed protein product [Cyprideis torosa]
MDYVTVFTDLESNDQRLVVSAKATLHEELRNVKDSWFVNGLVDYYLATGSNRCMEVLGGVGDPHDRFLLDRLALGISEGNSPDKRMNLKGHLSLLSFIINHRPPWLHELSSHSLLKELLRLILSTGDAVTLVAALIPLLHLLPVLPSKVANFLPDLFAVFDHVVTQAASRSDSNDSQLPDSRETEFLHLKFYVITFFSRLYGMFPCTFMGHVREKCGQSKIFRETVHPLLSCVRLHPSLVLSNSQSEKSDTERWKGQAPHVVLADIALFTELPPEQQTLPTPVLSSPPPFPSPVSVAHSASPEPAIEATPETTPVRPLVNRPVVKASKALEKGLQRVVSERARASSSGSSTLVEEQLEQAPVSKGAAKALQFPPPVEDEADEAQRDEPRVRQPSVTSTASSEDEMLGQGGKVDWDVNTFLYNMRRLRKISMGSSMGEEKLCASSDESSEDGSRAHQATQTIPCEGVMEEVETAAAGAAPPRLSLAAEEERILAQILAESQRECCSCHRKAGAGDRCLALLSMQLEYERTTRKSLLDHARWIQGKKRLYQLMEQVIKNLEADLKASETHVVELEEYGVQLRSQLEQKEEERRRREMELMTERNELQEQLSETLRRLAEALEEGGREKAERGALAEAMSQKNHELALLKPKLERLWALETDVERLKKELLFQGELSEMRLRRFREEEGKVGEEAKLKLLYAAARDSLASLQETADKDKSQVRAFKARVSELEALLTEKEGGIAEMKTILRNTQEKHAVELRAVEEKWMASEKLCVALENQLMDLRENTALLHSMRESGTGTTRSLPEASLCPIRNGH